MDGVKWIGSPNHYSGRAGHKVTHITLHIMAGFLAGTDSVFSRSSSQASAHYGIGAGGEIHQYVDETNALGQMPITSQTCQLSASSMKGV